MEAMRYNFLSPQDLHNLCSEEKGQRSKVYRGLGKLYGPLLKYVARNYIPQQVAPNVLTLAGLLCVIQAYYFCEMYMEARPVAVTAMASFLTFAYFVLHELDGLHAYNIRNQSILGEMFSDACGNIGTVFSTLSLCKIAGITDMLSCWHIVQILQLALLRYHVKAFKQGYLYFPILTGPGAAFTWFGLIVSVRLIFGPQWMDPLKSLFQTNDLVLFFYWVLLIISAVEATTLPFSSRNGTLFCLIFRAIPGIMMVFGLSADQDTTVDLICDGLFMSMLTTDMIVGRKAGRDLHPWIVLFAMASLLNNFLCLFLVGFYYLSLLYEISNYTKLPLLTTVVNVYCDGVYDMCHLGHKNAFKNAMKFGNRLFVGVMSDADCIPYKRKPIMNEKEREEAVRACKYVYRVIPHAPPKGIPEEFIKKHNIHIVAHGEEYEKEDDIYYAVPRKMGITRILPRTQGMSTSELIRRVCEYNEELLREKGLLAKK